MQTLHAGLVSCDDCELLATSTGPCPVQSQGWQLIDVASQHICHNMNVVTEIKDAGNNAAVGWLKRASSIGSVKDKHLEYFCLRSIFW